MQNPQNRKPSDDRSTDPGQGNSGKFVTLTTTDPSQFELALRPWELLARPKSSAAFRHKVAMLCGPGFIVYREAFSAAMAVVGLSPSGMLAIGIPLTLGNGGEYWRQVHGKSSCAITLPGPLDVTWNHAHDQIVALMDIDILRKSLDEREFEHLCDLARAHRVDLPPATRESLAASLNKLLNACETQPTLAMSPIYLSDTYDKLVNFVSLIAQATLREASTAHLSIRTRGFIRAIEFLRDNPSVNPSMAEVCEVAGTSERTLQYAFRDAFDLSPREFMARRRLHSVRRALISCDPKTASIGQIAMDHGIYELGRFAGRYRAYFGEKPSETHAIRPSSG